ncbi:hypothetical protein A2U01_0071884, partial [Trifolium medium]|nr:hypothetical protein [Trifolium medium]
FAQNQAGWSEKPSQHSGDGGKQQPIQLKKLQVVQQFYKKESEKDRT